MWDVTNRTPFSLFSGFDRDKDGKAYWLVWAKASFRMRHQRTCLFEPEQIALFREPQYRGEPNVTDLVADGDLCFPKARPDVLLTGHGRRPAGAEVDAPYDVGVSVGEWRKDLSVLPSMRWSQSLKPELAAADSGAVFLGYRNAYGGVDGQTDANQLHEFADNPIGQGYWASQEAAREKPLPRLIASRAEVSAWDQPMAPMALTAIARPWPARARFSGTYDEAWMRRKSPLLPDDFDTRYWQTVGEDQQLSEQPKAGTRIALRNIVVGEAEDAGMFETELPSLNFELFTRFKGKWQETAMQLQTLHLMPGQNLVTLTYCGAMPILAAGNDVLVDQSELTLRGHSGFRVRPEDAGRFDPSNTEVAA